MVKPRNVWLQLTSNSHTQAQDTSLPSISKFEQYVNYIWYYDIKDNLKMYILILSTCMNALDTCNNITPEDRVFHFSIIFPLNEAIFSDFWDLEEIYYISAILLLQIDFYL